jgi:NAD(P)-dependent dehydrogenase (short-subunit alcohol dehydrogenase family)
MGHILVAQVAKDRLTQQGKTAALDKFNQLINAFNGLTDGKSNTFIEAAVWADDIKEYGVKMFDEYHFTNVVYDPENMFKGMTQLQQDINAINTLGWVEAVLRANKDGITFERAFMARYLLHVVGDVHQPLHSVNMFNSKHKTGDFGGNMVHIITTAATNSTNINLHAYMDSMAGLQSFTERLVRPLDATATSKIVAMAAQFQQEYPASSFDSKLIENFDYHGWVVESWQNASNDVYPKIVEGQAISDAFDADMKALCKKRVALAGYRLAYVIGSLFA